MASTADEVRALLEIASDDGDAQRAASFFRTGPGEYAEGDVFLGVPMPAQRRIARAAIDLDAGERWALLMSEVHEQRRHPVLVHLDAGERWALLMSEVHEHRMTALLVLVEQYRRATAAGDASTAGELVEDYLAAARAERVDNWDLVDATAEQILGDWLRTRPRNVLFKLAKSDILWERRIAIVATRALIVAGDASTTFELAERLLSERTDLIQKAVGWMLREAGKRVSRAQLVAFLDAHAAGMGATALSYATEHLDPADRARYRGLRRTAG